VTQREERRKDPKGFYQTYQRPYYLNNKERIKRNDKKRFLKIYGPTIEKFEKLLVKQGGGCAICGQVNKNGKSLFVDHNHMNGKVRGLLCVKCNFILGISNDDIDLLRKAINYLGGRK